MSPRPSRRLARRLLLGQILVVAVGIVTVAGVALVVGPPVFRTHVERALGEVDANLAHHLDEAVTTMLLLSGALGVTAGVLTALVVSWLLASRIARPVEELSDTAERIAHGHLDARAASPGTDDELGDLTDAFNDMASSLEHVEQRRRRLLSDVAHELRTPLATVEGYLEGLEDGVVASEPATWRTLQDAAGRLGRLVDDLALVSRAEEGRLELAPEAIDVAALVADAVRASEVAAGEGGLRLTVGVDDDVPTVVGDEARLRQVLGNLLDNAIRHTPAGGRVEVVARRDGGEAVIEVADTGVGIPAADLPLVFERFYRADPSRAAHGGSGIGLTISRAIAHAHGGELDATSEGIGQGTRLTLRLPCRHCPE